MSTFIGWLKYVLDWRFLPVKFQNWLFSTGTRAVEFASGVSLIGYALVFVFSPDEIYNWPIYPAAFGRLCVETVFSGRKLAMD